MFRTTKSVLVAVSLSASALAVAVPAHAAPSEVSATSAKDYRNCDAMHRDFKNGVARSKKAARKQVKSDHKKPAVRPKVYRANTESDADKDGTACEVSA